MDQEFDYTTDPVTQQKENMPASSEQGGGFQQRKEEFIRDVKGQGKGFLAEQKTKTADILQDMANALHASANQLSGQAHPSSAHYLDQAAGGLERFSGRLRERDVEEITGKIQDFARRQPVLVLAGALLAGFYLARLLKSGAEQVKTGSSATIPGEFEETAPPAIGEVPIH